MKLFLGNFYWHLATFFWSHWLETKIGGKRNNFIWQRWHLFIPFDGYSTCSTESDFQHRQWNSVTGFGVISSFWQHIWGINYESYDNNKMSLYNNIAYDTYTWYCHTSKGIGFKWFFIAKFNNILSRNLLFLRFVSEFPPFLTRSCVWFDDRFVSTISNSKNENKTESTPIVISLRNSLWHKLCRHLLG